MRNALPMAVLMMLSATLAAVESFTLEDGRTLVGTYDADTGLLAIDDKVSVKVRARQIVKREPVEVPVAKPAAVAPAPVVAEKPATPRLDADPVATISAMQKRHRRELFDYACAWLGAADLELLPVKPLPTDPKKSEQAHHDRVARINGSLMDAREAQTLIRAGTIEQRWGQAESRVLQILQREDLVAVMAERDAERKP